MKVLRLVASLVVFLMVCVLVVAGADNTLVVDIQNGELIVDDYRVRLAEGDNPVQISMGDGGVTLRVQSAGGDLQLSFGDRLVSVTDPALPYVTLAEVKATSTPAPGKRAQPKSDKCPSCGIHVAQKADHFCPRCSSPYCAHDNIKCGYVNNPAPTPWSTRNSEGKTVYGMIADDGSYYIGTPDGKKPKEWQPGIDYLMSISPPPSPSPTPEFYIP